MCSNVLLGRLASLELLCRCSHTIGSLTCPVRTGAARTRCADLDRGAIGQRRCADVRDPDRVTAASTAAFAAETSLAAFAPVARIQGVHPQTARAASASGPADLPVTSIAPLAPVGRPQNDVVIPKGSVEADERDARPARLPSGASGPAAIVE